MEMALNTKYMLMHVLHMRCHDTLSVEGQMDHQ
jgi:hypothetical protein